jgi:hypothetical protein
MDEGTGVMKRHLYTDDHEHFRTTVREFIAREVTLNFDTWDEQGMTGREVWPASLTGIR